MTIKLIKHIYRNSYYEFATAYDFPYFHLQISKIYVFKYFI